MSTPPPRRRLAHRARTPWQRALDRVRAADPGWDRARTSARAVLAAAVGAGAATGVLALAGGSLAIAPLAGVVSLFGGITLPARHQRPRHLLLVAIAFTASAVVTTVAAPSPFAGRAALLVAIGVGAWCGRWGQRGVALGLQVFLGSFFVLLFDLARGDVVGVAVAGLLGASGLVLAERVLLPDRPAALLRRLVSSLLSQTSLMVDAAEALAGEGPGQGRQRRMRRRLRSVQEAALLVDTTLDDPDALGSVADPRQLRSDVLVVEALADHLAWAVLSIPVDTAAADRADLVGAMQRARVPMDDLDVQRPVAPLVPRLVGREDRTVEVLERLATAVERMAHAALPAPRQPAISGPTDGHHAENGPVPITRTVVQALLAGGLALALGIALEPQQWYWAVVGAYIVVTTTSSRGAGLRKAVDRVVGTALGVVVGLGLAYLVAEIATIGLVALLLLLFGTFWVFRINYRWMMLLLTMLVAVLYELTAVLSVRVLALRLAETALGAVVAGLVVFFVLPTPTRQGVDAAVDRLLAAMGDLLAAVAHGDVGTAAVRRVDQAVSEVRTTTDPLVTQTPTRIGGEVRAARLLATALRVRAGALATALEQGAGLAEGDDRCLAVLEDHLDRLRRHLAAPGTAAPAAPISFPSSGSDLGHVLQAIDDRLVGYGTARGLALRPDPGALAGGTPSPRD